MVNKKFIVIITLVIFMNIILFSKEIFYNNDKYKFNFKYDNNYIYIKPDLPKKFLLGVSNVIDLSDEHSMIESYKDQIIEKKKMIESGKYTPINRDLSLTYPIFYNVIKVKNNKNILYSLYFEKYSNVFGGKINYMRRIFGEISFFKDNQYFQIGLVYEDYNSFFNSFMNKSKDYFNYFFKKLQDEGGGYVFQSESKAKEFYEAIAKKDKRLPNDLIEWYDNFMKIVNSLEIN